MASLSPQEKAELDRILSAPGPLDVHAPLAWFHDAQIELWNSTAKVIAFVAGSQSGKTCAAPYITLREVARKFENGQPNEHLVASPTYPLMDKKLLPEYRRVIIAELGLGDFIAGEKAIRLSDQGIERITGQKPRPGTTVTIWFGHAQNAEALESATYKSAVLDEAGQDSFRSGAYEAVMRRVTINRGTIYILTTPYNRNWFYEKVFRRARVVTFQELPEGGFKRQESAPSDGDDSILVVTCPSIMNPSFPRSEWDFAMSQLPPWQFDMMYRGIFTKPLGVVFDCFDDDNLCERFEIPKEWPVFLGIDFGLVNTATLLVAEEWLHGEPTGRYFVFDAYRAGEARETRQHVREVHQRCNWIRPIAYGGAHAESGWREAWASAGIPVFEPTFSGLWVQINTLWIALHKKKLIVFNDLQEVIDEFKNMSRELDEEDVPIPDRIKDEKKYHFVAAGRYISTRLFRKIYRGLIKGGTVESNDSMPFPGMDGGGAAGDGGLSAGGGRGPDGRCRFFKGVNPFSGNDGC